MSICITDECTNQAIEGEEFCSDCSDLDDDQIECCVFDCPSGASASHNGDHYCQKHYLEQVQNESKNSDEDDEYLSDDLDTTPTSDECEHCNIGKAIINFNGTNLCEDCAEDYIGDPS